MKVKQAVMIYSVCSLFYHLDFMTCSNAKCFQASLTFLFF